MIDSTSNDLIQFIKDWFKDEGNEFIPLHRPIFSDLDKQYVTDCIESTFVSSVGKYVEKFEEMICEFTNSKFAVASSSGTTALQLSILSSQPDQSFLKEEIVLCPSLTFIGTINPIFHSGHVPYFLDAEKETLGMCPIALKQFFETETEIKEGRCFHLPTEKFVNSCLLVHIFGNPARVQEIKSLCDKYTVNLIEDAAESLGSWFDSKHTGTFGKAGALSFNGNKTITTGGGGILITNDEKVAKTAKHLSTTAKLPHKYEFVHDRTAFNYRLPNLNASLGCAQLEHLPKILEDKKCLFTGYLDFFKNSKEQNLEFVQPIENTLSNHWLNAIILESRDQRDSFLDFTNKMGIQTRPLWTPMHNLPHLKNFPSGNLETTNMLYDRVVNLPSSARLGAI